jgi:hypothetical protein
MKTATIGLLCWLISLVPVFGQTRLSMKPAEVARINAIEFQLNERETRQFSDGAWMVTSREQHQYEGQYRTQSMYYEIPLFETELRLTERITRTFENGRIVEEISEIDEDGSGTLVNNYRDTYTYESASSMVLTEWLSETWDGESWVNSERETYENTNGIPLTGTTQEWDGEDWINTYQYEVIEEAGDVRFFDYEWDGADWVPSYRTDYENQTFENLFATFSEMSEDFFDFLGLMPLVLLPDFTDYMWDEMTEAYVPETRQVSTRTMDETNTREVQRVVLMEDYDGENWVNSARVTIDFDAESDPEVGYFESFEDNAWSQQYRQMMQYDSNRNLSLVSTDLYNGEAYESYSETEFTWNQFTAIESDSEHPESYSIGKAYPNPFNPSLTIPFELGRANTVDIRVYDILGREIKTLFRGQRPAGSQNITFNASDLPSGMYLIRITVDQTSSIQRVTLLK